MRIFRSSLILFIALAMALSFTSVHVFAAPTVHSDTSIYFVALSDFSGPPDHSVVHRHGGTIVYSYDVVPAVAARLSASAADALSRAGFLVEPDGTVYAIDAELDNTWGVKRIGAGDVHVNGNLGTGIRTAIIDSGIDYTHPELSAQFAGGYDFVNNDNDPMDDNGHGTHVAGTVAAARDGVGVVGAAPEVALYGLKVLSSSGSGSWSNVVAALDWAAQNGIQVTNNSYGAGTNPGSVVQAAFDNSYAAGMLHIAAAGNSGNCGGKGNNVGYPARYGSVVAVAATTQNDTRPCWSSTGPDVEIAAPGVSINSTLVGGGYGTMSGTSMASPHVVGVSALVMAAGVTVNADVRQILSDTADDLGDPNQYGAGLVNAVSAVAAAVPPPPPDPSVAVSLTTDKENYVSGEDAEAVLTAVVSDENGDAISGLDSGAFATTLNGAAVSAAFVETAAAGTYTATLDLTVLADGSYVVETTVTDTRGLSASDSASFTLGPAPEEPANATTVSVDSIVYSTNGGRNNDRHLNVTVSIVNDLGEVVSGATVSIDLYRDGGFVASGSGTTNSEGAVTFSMNNAPSGCYSTVVTNVSADGLTWDGATPANEFCK